MAVIPVYRCTSYFGMAKASSYSIFKGFLGVDWGTVGGIDAQPCIYLFSRFILTQSVLRPLGGQCSPFLSMKQILNTCAPQIIGLWTSIEVVLKTVFVLQLLQVSLQLTDPLLYS